MHYSDDPYGIFEYENRIQAWIDAHTAWSHLMWPSYIGPDTSPFNQFRVAPAGGGEPIYGGDSLPSMIIALARACADGTCRVRHEHPVATGRAIWYAR